MRMPTFESATVVHSFDGTIVHRLSVWSKLHRRNDADLMLRKCGRRGKIVRSNQEEVGARGTKDVERVDACIDNRVKHIDYCCAGTGTVRYR